MASLAAPCAPIARAGSSTASRRGSALPTVRGVRLAAPAASRRSNVVVTAGATDSMKGALSFYPPLFYSTPIQIATVPSVLGIAFAGFGGAGIVEGDLLQVAQIAATAIGFVHIASGAGAALVASETGKDVAPAVAKSLLIGFPAFLEILLKDE